jgi:hyperosmotically inducible protein
VSCSRPADTSSPEKTAKDLGRATADFADKAGKRIEEATKEAGVSGDDVWITTKVKSELTTQGFDPLHVHVDTAGKVVTLSGSVETAADARKAVNLAKAVKGVAAVEDHLFVKPDRR